MSKLLQMVFRFFKYLIQSKSRYSIHSPFVFDFLNDVIRSKKDYYCFSLIQKTKQQLHYNHTKINITELGAGSHVNNNKQKKISTIMRNASKPHSVSKILFEIVNYFPIQNSIEIGTSLGISTLYIAHAKKNNQVYTLEGCPETAKIAQQNFKNHPLNTIQLIQGNFNATLQPLVNSLQKVDFVFFDGNHQKQPTIDYFEICLQKAHEKSVFVFDDIHWSEEMEQAWAYIKNHPKVTVTIDLFWIGIVFFRTEQVKEHFIINPYI